MKLMPENFEKWYKHFVPECYFDTVLIKMLLETDKNVLHKKGCNNVINELRKGTLRDSFAVAIIDKDKKEIDYLKDCNVISDEGCFLLWKHMNKPHFIFQLVPPLEKWIIFILEEIKIDIASFDLPANYKELKRVIKFEIDSERNEKLKRLISTIVSESESVKKLKRSLIYLKVKNYQFDVNELKNV